MHLVGKLRLLDSVAVRARDGLRARIDVLDRVKSDDEAALPEASRYAALAATLRKIAADPEYAEGGGDYSDDEHDERWGRGE